MRIWSVCLVMVAVAACSDEEDPPTQPVAGSRGGDALASATIAPKSGNTTLAGTASFSGTPGAISITVSVTGAPPGEHGVHLHETGDCSAADAMSAGGHWNPAMANMHGMPDATAHHIGDLGNLTVAADGTGTLTRTNAEWAIGGAPEKNPVGKAIIVHAMVDDFSQPVGNAGGRIGCGVIN